MKPSLLSCLTSCLVTLGAITAFGAQAADAAKAAPKGDATRGQAVAATVPTATARLRPTRNWLGSIPNTCSSR